MAHLPVYIPLVFGLTVLVALGLFYRATRSSGTFLVAVLLWIAVQSALGLSGFYTGGPSMPPRFPLLILPPLLTIVTLFASARGRRFVDSLDQKTLTLFHVIRVPVELVLFWLFLYKGIPGLMTFEGRNFDLLSGLSAPIIYYYGYVQKTLSRTVLIGWNLVCLALVLNVVTYALLSAPTPFQQLGFEQPNVAVQYFPFVLLPSVLVPLVLLAHLATLRQLLSTSPETVIQPD